MAGASEQRLFLALATLTRGFAVGEPPASAAGAKPRPGGGARDDPGEAPATDTSGAPADLAAMDAEAREALGEAALAVAFNAFAAQGGGAGPMQALIAALGLMATLAGEEPDPPAEILGIAAEEARVAAEMDRAAEALDTEFGHGAAADAVIAALDARILGTAITLAGRTLPGGMEGQAAVRLQAARCLTRLAAGLLAMNTAGDAGAPGPSSPAAPRDPQAA